MAKRVIKVGLGDVLDLWLRCRLITSIGRPTSHQRLEELGDLLEGALNRMDVSFDVEVPDAETLAVFEAMRADGGDMAIVRAYGSDQALAVTPKTMVKAKRAGDSQEG